MDIKLITFDELIIWIFIAFLSTWGGVVKHILDNKKRNSKREWRGFFEQTIISCFSGLLAGLFCFEGGFSMYTTLIFSGLFGTMGGSGIELLRKYFFRQGKRNERK